jgi:hypothetical protein
VRRVQTSRHEPDPKYSVPTGKTPSDGLVRRLVLPSSGGKCVLFLLFFVTLATACIAGSIVYMGVPRSLMEEHLKLASAQDTRSLFQDAVTAMTKDSVAQ